MAYDKKAMDTFLKEFSCSQAVVSARCEKYGLDQKRAIAMATGFGGGMGRTGNTCGAVTGAISIIGLAGSEKEVNKENKEDTYKTVRKFVKGFEEDFGSVNCTDLLGCNIATPAGYETARKQGMFENICPKFVDGALEILDRVMEEDRARQVAREQMDAPRTQ